MRTVRTFLATLLLFAAGAGPGAAQPGAPLGTAQLQISGARLTLYSDALTTDAEQTINVGEAARVRTCYGAGAACGTAAPGSVPGLKVVGDLSGPELPQAIPYETVPGGTFFLPGFQREGDYLLTNIRLVETATGRVFANAEPSLATLHVRQILLASATVTRLTLADLQARGIALTQANFNAFSFAVGFVFSGTTVTIELPVLYEGNGLGQILEKPRVLLDGLPSSVANAVRRWEPPNIVPFQLNATGPRVPSPGGGGDDETREPEFPLYGAIILPGNVSFLNQFFDAKLIVANGAPNGSGATLENVTGVLKLPSGEVLRLAATAPPVAAGQKLPVLKANGQGALGPGEQAFATWTVEGLVPGTHVLRMDIEADLARPGRPVLATGGVVQAAVEVVDARFQLAFNHPDVVRTGEPYSLYVTVTNLSRATQNLVTVDLASQNISGAHKLDAQESFSKTIPTLEPGESETLEYKLVADVTGTCVATTFQAAGGLSGVIHLRAGVGEAGIPLSPAALVLPRFTNLLPKSLVDANVRFLGLAYSLATAPAGAGPAGLPHVVKSDVVRRAVDLGEAGQRLYLQDRLLESLEALSLDQLGNRDDLADYDTLRRLLERAAQASTALADLFRREQQSRNLAAADFVDHFASTMSYGRPWMSAALVPNGSQPAPTLEVRQVSGAGTTFLAYASDDPARLRTLPYGEVYAVNDVPGGTTKLPFALVGRLDPAASYRVDLYAPATAASGRLILVVPSDDLAGFRKVDFGFVSMNANEVWEVRAVKAAGDAALTFVLAFAGSGIPVPGVPAPSISNLALPPFRVIGAVQDPDLDRYGLGISYLFNRPPDKASAETPSSYVVKSSFHGEDAATPAVVFDKVVTKAGAAAFWQPNSERVVNVRYQTPISALNGIFAGQPVIRHEHLLVTNAIRDTHGTPLDPQVPDILIDPNRTGGLVDGRVLRGDGTPAAGARVQLLRYRKVSNPDAPDHEILLIDLVAEVSTGTDGAFYFDFIEEPPPPGRTIGSPPRSLSEQVQSGFVLQAIVPAGADPVLQPEEREQVSTKIRLQNRLLHVNIALLGRGTVKGTLVYQDNGAPATDGSVAAASTLFLAQRSTPVASDGSFTFGGLPVGPITLSGRDGAGNRVYETVGIQRPGDVVNVTLRLGRTGPQKTGTVAATVLRLRSGSPPVVSPGAAVAVYAEGHFIEGKTSDSLGNATFRNVPAGRVSVQAADFSISRTPAITDLTLAADATVTATLVLADAAPRSVIGRVLFHDGPTNTNLPVPGAVAFITGPGVFAYTDATGTYRIDGVPVQAAGAPTYILTAFDNVRGLQGQTPLPPVVEGDGSPILAADILLVSMSGGIDGVVLDPLGRTAGGIAVTLGNDQNGNEIAASSAGDGRFSFDDIAVGSRQVFAHVGDGLTPGRVGYFGQATAKIVFGGHRPFVTIRMAGSGVVNVRTRTSASQGVLSPIFYRPTVYANAAIKPLGGSPIETSTDPDGRLTLVLPVGPFALTAVNPLNGNKSLSRTIDYPGQVINLDIVFDTASTVTGRVVGVDGVTPVPNADVSFSASGLLPQAQRTDGQGAFRYELVPQGRVSVTAAALVGSVERVGRADGYITGPGQTLDLTVVMKAQGTVRGQVVDLVGSLAVPLAFAQYYVQESGYPNRRLPVGTGFFSTDAQGIYEVAHVFAGGVTVVARDRNQVTRQGSARGEITADFQVLTLPDVVISTSVGSLGVTVRDPDSGGPVADAQVTLSNGDMTVADANGQASFDALPLGTYSVHAFHAPTGRGGLTTGLRLQAAGDRVDAIVLLDTRGQILGTLFDDPGKTAPVGGGTILLTGRVNGRSWGTSISALATTSSDPVTLGRFLFDGIPPGSFDLAAGVATSPRRAAAALTTTPTAPVVSVDLVLEPVADRFVRLFESLTSGVSEVNPGSGVYALTLTQPWSCPPCTYTFTVAVPSSPYPGHLFSFPAVLTSQSLKVAAQESSGEQRTGSIDTLGGVPGAGTSSDPYRLVLRPKGRVTVTVRDALNQPAQASVTIDSSGRRYAAATDASGQATFDAVLSGTVYASARVASTGFGGTATGTLTFDDQTLSLSITLAAAVSAHGVVYRAPAGDLWDGNLASLTPEPGAIVSIVDSGQLQVVAAASDGSYRFEVLHVGQHTISASDATGQAFTSATVDLAGPNGNDNALPPLVLDASRPLIVSIVPPPGSIGISRNAPVEIAFSEPLLATVLPTGGSTSPYFTLRSATGNLPGGAWTALLNGVGQQVVRFTPSGLYENSTVYSVTIAGGPSGVRDRAGRPLSDSGNVGSNFTTSDTVGPGVVGTTPSLDRPVDPIAPIRFDFSEVVTATPQELDGSGPTPAAQLFWQQNGSSVWQPIPISMFLTRGGYSLTIEPPTGVTYSNDSLQRRVHVSRLKDSIGNAMADYDKAFRIYDQNPPHVDASFPASAPTGQLVGGTSYTLTPVLSNLDDLPQGDVDRVEYFLASAGDPATPASTPAFTARSAPWIFTFVAAYAGNGIDPRPFPVWVKGVDTSTNPSNVVKLAMNVLPNAPPVIASVAASATAPVAGTFHAGSSLAAQVAGVADPDGSTVTLTAELRKDNPSSPNDPADLVASLPSQPLTRPGGGWSALAPPVFTSAIPISMADGTSLFFRVKATDALGASVTAESARFAVAHDPNAPVVDSFVARLSGASSPASQFFIGQKLLLEFRARDAETAVRTTSIAFSGVFSSPQAATLVGGTTNLYRTGELTVPATVPPGGLSVTATAAAADWGGNTGTLPLTFTVTPTPDPYAPVVTWLTPWEGGGWPSSYTSTVSPQGAALLLRVKVADLDRIGGLDVPGSIASVQFKGPVDAGGTLASTFVDGSLVAGTGGPGAGVYEALWRVPNGVALGTQLPFQVRVVDAGANATSADAHLRSVRPRKVYEATQVAALPADTLLGGGGDAAGPVFLLDGAVLSLYPQTAPAVRMLPAMYVYAGGVVAGASFTPSASILTAPEVTSYASSVLYNPLELTVTDTFGVGHGARVDVTAKGLLGSTPTQSMVLPGQIGSQIHAGGSHGGSGGPGSPGGWTRTD
ncbi:MAG: Ig-like domain-containing protein, partial [Thermoanaerobaculia bacterium]|nr:Ig-like domain-containing protein [Thermoanaerobaculia bacterium]